jgi:hypothetical protein
MIKGTRYEWEEWYIRNNELYGVSTCTNNICTSIWSRVSEHTKNMEWITLWTSVSNESWCYQLWTEWRNNIHRVNIGTTCKEWVNCLIFGASDEIIYVEWTKRPGIFTVTMYMSTYMKWVKLLKCMYITWMKGSEI